MSPGAAWLTGVAVGVVLGIVAMLPLAKRWSRLAERRISEAERRARAAERLAELGSMTGGLAHEIKNPLSTIGLNAQLLAEEISESDLPEAQRDRLVRRVDALNREASRLRDILTDFLRFAGRVKIDPHLCELNRLVEELADFFHPQADQAGVLLRTDLSKTPIQASVDESLLKQAVLNLMINAAQAMGDSPGPRGELILRTEGDDSEVRLHVIDTGPGIPAEKLESIFLPYVSYKSGGTGLGLPTTRRIVEEHGGRLSVHSEVGRGSDFIIHLPLRSPGATTESQA